MQTLELTTACRTAAPWALGVALIVVPFAWTGGRILRERRQLLLWLALLTLPFALMRLAGDLLHTTYNTRFVAWMWIPVTLFLGAGLAASLRRRQVVGGLLLACVAISALSFRTISDRYRNEDMPGTADFLRRHPVRPVAVSSGYMAPPLLHYFAQKVTVSRCKLMRPSVEPTR